LATKLSCLKETQLAWFPNNAYIRSDFIRSFISWTWTESAKWLRSRLNLEHLKNTLPKITLCTSFGDSKWNFTNRFVRGSRDKEGKVCRKLWRILNAKKYSDVSHICRLIDMCAMMNKHEKSFVYLKLLLATHQTADRTVCFWLEKFQIYEAHFNG